MVEALALLDQLRLPGLLLGDLLGLLAGEP
jgi:hypothetical protein